MGLLGTPIPTLSLKKFEVDVQAGTLEIRGRATGLIGFILSLIGISPISTIKMTHDRIQLTQASLGAQERAVFPMPAIESTVCGHRRNLVLLVVAGVFLVVALSSAASGDLPPGVSVVLLLFAAVFVLAFIMSRRLILEIYCGAQRMSIAFKEATVGNKRIDKDTALAAIEVINDRLVDTHMARG